jgi:hypothetical protein
VAQVANIKGGSVGVQLITLIESLAPEIGVFPQDSGFRVEALCGIWIASAQHALLMSGSTRRSSARISQS